jgi:tetratricopeptide (TPR) repeat protein
MTALLLVLLLNAADLDQAEREYRAGRFEQALALYETALSEPDAAQGPILFNMGNCAFRLGRLAEAVLHYKRARLRLPRDREAAFNLHLAEWRLGIDSPDRETFGAAVAALAGSFTPRELLVLSGVLQAAGLVGFVLLRRRRASRNVMALLMVLALAGAARMMHDQWFAGPPAAVVLDSGASLRPLPDAGEHATILLDAGETVRVEEISDQWIKVRHVEGNGWTERTTVGLVD